MYKWEPRRNNWVKHDSNIIKFELPRDTIVEAEIVTEMKGEVSFLSCFKIFLFLICIMKLY